MRDLIAEVWQRLNPVDPSPTYLLKFLGAAIVLFAIALMIGRAV